MPIVRPSTYRRKQIRLPDYDYSTPGAYFITFRARPGAPPLSHSVNGELTLSAYGMAVKQVWRGLPKHYPNMTCDEFIAMPDHVHCIIILDGESAGLRPATTNGSRVHGMPEIVRAHKGFSIRRINQLRRSTGTAVWQRNCFERVVRNERELQAVREYIRGNPVGKY